MYERNAIVLERYFNQMFGYNLKNNIKVNFTDYCKLIESLEKYKEISEEEENIASEYDLIASRITEIQNNQELLNKKNEKLQQLRMEIFQNIDDNSENIQRKIFEINNSIQNINEEIKENAQKFVDYVDKFNEKTLVRTKCERSMRTIEADYNKRLNEILDNYKDIDIVIEKKIRSFIESETNEIEEDLKNRITKNGEKEKVPFSMDVMEKAISLCIEIQKNESRIFINIYDKSNKLFNEIKNNTIKIEKHKKIIKDSKSELEFLGAMKEYLVQFLDNERLTAVNGEKDHNNLMKEACSNLEKDLTQINNLYTLLKKEISNKATKKVYADLYNIEYLKDLERIAEEFDLEVKKLNLSVTIINPNYWRIEGMRKIYDIFNNCVTESYERNIFEFIPKEEEKNVSESKEELDVNSLEQNSNKDIQDEESENTNTQNEINKKIDLILGFNGSKIDEDEEEDNWDNNIDEDNNIEEKKQKEEESDDEDDDGDWNFDNNTDLEDEWDDNIEEDDDSWDTDEENDENNDEWNNDEFDEDWEENKNIVDEYNSFAYNDTVNDEEESDFNIDEDEEKIIPTIKDESEIFEEASKTTKDEEKKNKRKNKKNKEEAEEILSKSEKKKGKHTKKGGFFSKFKK